MAVSTNDASLLREWAPLSDLLNRLPLKPQLGFFTKDVRITCLDVLPEFIALGTNCGIIYWYDRKKKDLERLRCEKSNICITALKITSTVDYMLACGNKTGNVSIFQIPKSHPDTLPENLKTKNKQVERYTVNDLHKSPITALEWSKNGMKLFSGDKNGCVILTEIDFYMHICKSLEILNEAYEIIQLSYNHHKLLVSTLFRSVICEKIDKWRVAQVGKKDRKVLGRFGGIIYQNGLRNDDIVLYCSRPGLRIWISDLHGDVLKTLVFKDLFSRECFEVPLINPISKNIQCLKPQREPSFGIILPFGDNLLVTHSQDVVYILDPQEMTVISTISQLRSILCITSHKDEIFILEEDRNVIRISYRPETCQEITTYSSIENTFSPITAAIRDLTTKLQSATILSTVTPLIENTHNSDVNIYTDEHLIVNAEEARESPRKTPDSSSYRKTFDNVEEHFNDILFRKKKHKKKNMSASTSSLSSNSSTEDKQLNCITPIIMSLSSVGVLPDLRSPQSIRNDIEYKEKILADILSFDKVKINLTHDDEQLCLKNNKSALRNNPASLIIDDIPTTLHHDNYNKMKTDEENSAKIGVTFTNISSEVSLHSHFGSITHHNAQDDTSYAPEHSVDDIPGCVDIPNDWKLSEVMLNPLNRTNSCPPSDNSLSDWELV